MLLAATLFSVTGFAVFSRKTVTASAAPVTVSPRAPFFTTRIVGSVPLHPRRFNLSVVRDNLSLMQGQLDRTQRIIELSHSYDTSLGLAATIFDASIRERIDPDLAFRLIRLESDFNPRATSSAGAVGLTQLMPSTAALYEKGVTRDQLMERSINVRIGFRYLRTLVDLYKGNIHLALLAYNQEKGCRRARPEARGRPGQQV